MIAADRTGGNAGTAFDAVFKAGELWDALRLSGTLYFFGLIRVRNSDFEFLGTRIYID
jgi:hypothetical protein